MSRAGWFIGLDMIDPTISFFLFWFVFAEGFD